MSGGKEIEKVAVFRAMQTILNVRWHVCTEWQLAESAKDDSVQPHWTRRTPCDGVILGLGVIDDVRTNNTQHDTMMRLSHEVGQMLSDQEGKQILANIRMLRERFEPEALVRKASEHRRAMAA